MVTNNKGKHRFFANGIKVQTLCKDTSRCQIFESRDFPFNHEIGVNQQKYTVNKYQITRNICTDHNINSTVVENRFCTRGWHSYYRISFMSIHGQ